MTDPDPNFIIAPASKHRRAKEELRDFDNRIESSLPWPCGAVGWINSLLEFFSDKCCVTCYDVNKYEKPKKANHLMLGLFLIIIKNFHN